jgi:hypothetical protein
MKEQVTAIIESFEAGSIPEGVALARLEDLTGNKIDGDWLRNYWRSESIEDFVDRLFAEPVADWERITDTGAMALIAEFLRTESPGRRDSIDAALAKRYGKPIGAVVQLVFRRGLSEPNEILNQLRKDTRIYL